MIFITVGSQKFQFNRLLKEVDDLIEKDIINEKVYAQSGASTYIPRNYEYKDFTSREEFKELLNKSDIVITHGGTGAIINALKCNKKVIGVPRLKEFSEHVDDHQIQILKEFKELNYIEVAYNINDLGDAIKNIKNKNYNRYVSNTESILSSISDFIES